MEILLNKDNWRFVINSLIIEGYVHVDQDDKTLKSFEDLEKVFSVESDFKTLCFVIAEENPKKNKKVWYCITRFVHEEVYNTTETRKVIKNLLNLY